jgi:23S rRNA pseudouridine2604 synthase
MSESIRLSKRVAELRACSRREAELLIAGGWVRVNGVIVEQPQFRVVDETIDIDPQADISLAEPVTLLLNKPVGAWAEPGDRRDAPSAAECLGVDSLWQEDRSGRRPLKLHFSQLTACAPLETGASGLVVYTQDWRIVRKLTEDAATLEHEIVVEVAGELGADGLARLNRGIAYQGRTPPAIKVSWQNETRLRVALKGARPGEVAHMCSAVGVQLVSMKRIRLGRLSMGKVPLGQWRYLGEDERF